MFELESKIVRNQILSGEPRIDGRDTRTVRPISIRTGVLPRTHGSALFTRGETQAIVVATLGTARDEQRIDALMGEYTDRFMLHYNMPPYATGETGRVGTPKRREIGHGRLAKRALLAVLPTAEEFAYSMRVVSEITESNGSSSMASVCGASLALMDAGVPTKAHVAGIAMGLIKEGNRFAVLTDILGDEDHLGDMDFKVAGTDRGITALQMDIKIQGITKEIMAVALSQAREGRMHILHLMQEALPHARTEVSQHAPRMMTFKINPEKIRDVIGKGGAVIRALTEETGTTIDIQDDGTITIASVNADACNVARKRIEDITAEVEVGRIYEGTVLRLLDFGAIVQVLPGKDGLLHISQIAKERVNQVSDYVKEGQIVRVKVLEADDKGRLRLSMKAAAEEAAAPARPHPWQRLRSRRRRRSPHITGRRAPARRPFCLLPCADPRGHAGGLRVVPCPGKHRMKQAIGRTVIERPVPMTRHQLSELQIGLALQGIGVDAQDIEVFHYAPAADVARATIAATAGEHEILQRIEERPEVSAGKIEYHDVRLRAGGESAEIVASQRLRSSKRRSAIEVGHRRVHRVAFHYPRDVQAELDVVQKIRRPRIRAQPEVDAGRSIPAERIEGLAVPCEYRGTVGDAGAALDEATPVVAGAGGGGGLEVAAEVDAVRQDRPRREQAQLLQPLQRRGATQPPHRFELVDRLAAMQAHGNVELGARCCGAR